MESILVPTDFSKISKQALQFAIELCGIYKAKIAVFHVIEMPSNALMEYPFHGEVIKEMKKQANDNYLQWVKDIDDHESILEFSVQQNSVIAAIEKYIKEKDIDLVVMGTQGASGLSEFFIGSNTEKIVRYSPVPVFAIKESVKISTIKNIVFPTQLGLNEARLVNKVKDLQKHLGAHLHIVYINTPINFKSGSEIGALMKDYVEHYHFTDYSTHEISDMYEESGIMAFANSLTGAMIAMGTHSRKGLSHLFRGSIAENVVNKEECPIWTYSLR